MLYKNLIYMNDKEIKHYIKREAIRRVKKKFLNRNCKLIENIRFNL